MAGIFTKTVKGRKYTYFEYFEDGKTVQKYCGPEGSDTARKKALEFEYDILSRKKDGVVQRMQKIREEMNELRQAQVQVTVLDKESVR